MFIFPGLGLGVILAKSKYISDNMLMASAEALADYTPLEDLAMGKVYPDVQDIRKVGREGESKIKITVSSSQPQPYPCLIK